MLKSLLWKLACFTWWWLKMMVRYNFIFCFYQKSWNLLLRKYSPIIFFKHEFNATNNLIKESETYSCVSGIFVEWDKGLRVYITLEPRHMGNICGLCGNYDNKAENDFRARSGQLEETSLAFANSWRSQPTCPILAIDPVHPCQQNPNRLYWATYSCNIMRSSAFQACHSYVSDVQDI